MIQREGASLLRPRVFRLCVIEVQARLVVVGEGVAPRPGNAVTA
jgi:hypothetical protein